MKATFRKLILAGAGLYLRATSAFAVVGSETDLIDKMSDSAGKIGGKIVNLVLTIGLIAGIVMSLPALIKYLRGEHDSSNALTKVGLGLIIFVAIVFIIKAAGGF